MTDILLKLLTLLLSTTPLGIFSIWLYEKHIRKVQNSLSNTTTLVTPLIGTFAKEKMEIKSIVFGEQKLTAQSGEYLSLSDGKTEKQIERAEINQFDQITYTAAITAHCHYEKVEHTEIAVKSFLDKAKVNIHKIGDKYKVIQDIENDGDKKMTTVIAITRDNPEEIFSFSKGHPLELIKRCNRIRIDGKNIELENKIRKRLRRRIKKINESGEKIICFAYKPLPKKRYDHYKSDYAENDLVLISMVGIGHRIFEKEKAVIAELKKIDVNTLIIDSARERKVMGLARELNLVNSKHFEMINHDMLRDLNDKKLANMLKQDKDYLFCETSEEDKQRILQTLQNIKQTPHELNKNTKLSEVIDSFIQAKKHHSNFKLALKHALSSKMPIFILTLSALLFAAPLPLHFLEIIAIDLVIALPLQIILNQEQAEKSTESAWNFAVLSSIVITFLYFWSLIRFGWYPNMQLEASSYHHISSQLILSLLLFTHVINAFKYRLDYKQAIKNRKLQIITLSIAVVTAILIKNSFLDWITISYVLISIYLIDEIKRICYQKLQNITD